MHAGLRERGELCAEVLCHEFAHVAVYRLYGAGARPHGAEWAGLMEMAGFPARTRVAVDLPEVCRHRGFMYLHRCPVCQVVRPARTRAERWRCAQCGERMVVQ